MYINRYTREMHFSSKTISCTVKTIEGYNAVHSHEFYELELVLDGEGTYTVDGNKYEICPGALLFMSPASFHEAEFTKQSLLINIMFEANMCDSRLLYALFSLKSHIWTYVEEGDLAFLETVCRELANCLENRIGSDIFSRALLDSIAAKVLLLTENGKPEINYDSVQKAVVYIHSHFTGDISLTEVAAVTGYSPSYFSERFHRYVGVSFRDYVSDLRFFHAEKLLKYTDMSVTEICFECGFNNYAHFMKSFKSRYKTTPVAYRKQQGTM